MKRFYKQGVTSYICTRCKAGKHEQCANASPVLKGICGCVHEICETRRVKEKKDAAKSKIS